MISEGCTCGNRYELGALRWHGSRGIRVTLRHPASEPRRGELSKLRPTAHGHQLKEVGVVSGA
jgi:hypothetical protein